MLGADGTANRTSREAAITNRRIRGSRDDTTTDDVQGVGTIGKVDSVRTAELEGVDGLAARREVCAEPMEIFWVAVAPVSEPALS